MKPFSKHDWYGFSGAEEEQDKPALIGYSGNFIIVVDIHGIGVYPTDSSEAFGIELPYYIATIVAEKMETMTLSTEILVSKFGFTRY